MGLWLGLGDPNSPQEPSSLVSLMAPKRAGAGEGVSPGSGDQAGPHAQPLLLPSTAEVWGPGLEQGLSADFSSSWPAPTSTAGPSLPPGEGPTGCRRERERKQERGRSQERRQPSSSSSEKQRFYSCDRFGGREHPQPKPSLSSHPTSPTAGEPGPPPQVSGRVAWAPFSSFLGRPAALLCPVGLSSHCSLLSSPACTPAAVPAWLCQVLAALPPLLTSCPAVLWLRTAPTALPPAFPCLLAPAALCCTLCLFGLVLFFVCCFLFV